MALPQDDLKWFGEGFDGFPRRIPEDCVDYSLFVINAELGPTETQSRLNAVQTAATELTQQLTQDYVWQREPFNLHAASENDVAFLHGRTVYGDSVEDEWLIVYLVRELTKKFSDLWVKAVDSDGQFLLIEAAKALPPWLNPEIADNRVWLHEGSLLIIPVFQQRNDDVKAFTTNRSLTLKEGLDAIRKAPSRLLHSNFIESEAFYRLHNYPAQIALNVHHTLAIVPRILAYILHQNPALISPAVEAFFLRDPIATRPLQSSDSGAARLTFPPQDLVTVCASFSKVGYAQLKGQQFVPPPAWADVLPKDTTSKDLSRVELGMKMACAFEMLVSDRQNVDKDCVKPIQKLIAAVKGGGLALPSDEEIQTWDHQEDDESWLDVNFEDFERELSGKAAESRKKGTKKGDAVFGDQATEENLRKMVERFEDFLNDDTAGLDGAEVLEDMDYDDEEDTSDISSDGEDKEVSFDEQEFARMMREMMGMPADADMEQLSSRKASKGSSQIEELDDDDDDDDEAEGIKKVMEQMEAELNAAGALDLDPTPKKIAATRNAIKGKQAQKAPVGAGSASDIENGSEDGEIDVDINLAKNLLESFKSQAGMAGPGGNLMGLMGMHLPRDEGDEQDEDDDAGPGSNKSGLKR